MTEKSLHQVEEHLLCAICHERFCSPKQLPCQHTFCKQCLPPLVERNKIICPSCRKEVKLPVGGVGALPSNRLAANILDAIQSAKKDSTDVHQTCLVHRQLCDMYCPQCNTFICRQCPIEKHGNHRYDTISSCAQKSKKRIQEELDLLRKKFVEMSFASEALDDLDRQLVKNSDDAKSQINALASRLIKTVQRSQKKLLREVQETTDNKRNLISLQKKEADNTRKTVESCQHAMEKMLVESTDAQLVTRERQALLQLEAVGGSIDISNLQQVESLEVNFIENEELEESSLDTLGSVSSPRQVFQHCKASGAGLHVATVGESASFEIAVEECDSLSTAVFVCRLDPINPNFVCKFARKKAGLDTIVCYYTPTRPGPHKLSVCVGDQDIPNSPFFVQVIPLAGKPTNIIEGLNKPHGVIVRSHKNQLVVAEKGLDCITLVDIPHGIRQMSLPVKKPHGLALTLDKKVLAVSQGNHSIVVVDFNQKEPLHEEVGGKEHSIEDVEPLSFNTPAGIAASKEKGTIFVTEYNSKCVQILNANFAPLRHIYLGYLHRFLTAKWPIDVALDCKGRIYVVVEELTSGQVIVYTPDGVEERRFGGDRLRQPSAIALTSKGIVFVADECKHQLVVFNSEGKFLMEFGSRGSDKGEFNMPVGLAIDAHQVLYVSDSGNNRIVTYKLQ